MKSHEARTKILIFAKRLATAKNSLTHGSQVETM